jgi:hypothetical protein
MANTIVESSVPATARVEPPIEDADHRFVRRVPRRDSSAAAEEHRLDVRLGECADPIADASRFVRENLVGNDPVAAGLQPCLQERARSVRGRASRVGNGHDGAPDRARTGLLVVGDTHRAGILVTGPTKIEVSEAARPRYKP